MTEHTPSTMITLTIDGHSVTVPKGTTVYHAAQQLGIEVPIFCYHDRMPPFGACRMCLVEVEKMGKLQTSCTLEATEGMLVKTQTQTAEEGRESILEFLLINHPLDCPICDRGGECPLQEQTLKFGPGKSRFYEEKRHFSKRHPLGPVLMLDRERCIACARCTRFGDIVAGDNALEFINRGYKTEVGTPDGGPVDSKFIGNTIMICPVGALTSQVYRFRARPWDNTPTNSTCTLCPVGCSMILDSRDGEVMRTRACENKHVNDVWMCDKGWFGYEFSSSQERIQKPLIRNPETKNLEPASWNEALTFIARKVNEHKSSGKIAAFGGNPLTTEENFLYQKLFRDIIGINHVDHRIGTSIYKLEEEELPPGMSTKIEDIENVNYAILLGLDLTEEFPVIWLRLRQAINKGGKVLFIGHYAPEIARHLYKTVVHPVGQEIESIQNLSTLLNDIGIDKASKGAIFIGKQYLSTVNRSHILSSLKKVQASEGLPPLNIMEGRGNSLGARIAGMHPQLHPLEKSITSSTSIGYSAIEVLQQASSSQWGMIYIAGANPAKKYPKQLWDKVRNHTDCIVVQDIFLTETAKYADVVLPTLSYIEKGGSFINIERRVLPLFPGKIIPEGIYSDSEIFCLIANKLGSKLAIDAFFRDALGSFMPYPANGTTYPQTHATAYSQLPTKKATLNQAVDGTSLKASFCYRLFDEGVRMKHNPHVIQMVKPPHVRIHPDEGKKRQLKNGNSISLHYNNVEIKTTVFLDDNVALETIVLPIGFDEIPVQQFDSNLLNGMCIEVR